ncbi:hypothetical protein FE263_16890 [Lichenicoccus roseus]|uniref:Transposase DDE domain-containing protein n=1 Tax=Lichenicoccus roseus TaxID=2683649 RepID=A0A5R9J7F2_9PROT|nr:hypothetical protein FE263_16890 [Lichenicoccus roseus]
MRTARSTGLRFSHRNVIERMFCRLKDYRGIATRYDKLAANSASAVYLTATISFWLCVRALGAVFQHRAIFLAVDP